MDEASITALVGGIAGLELLQLWHTDDLRVGRVDKWLNLLVQMVDSIGL